MHQWQPRYPTDSLESKQEVFFLITCVNIAKKENENNRADNDWVQTLKP